MYIRLYQDWLEKTTFPKGRKAFYQYNLPAQFTDKKVFRDQLSTRLNHFWESRKDRMWLRLGLVLGTGKDSRKQVNAYKAAGGQLEEVSSNNNIYINTCCSFLTNYFHL